MVEYFIQPMNFSSGGIIQKTRKTTVNHWLHTPLMPYRQHALISGKETLL